MQGNGIHTMMHILVGILFFATLVGILARKMRFPYHCGSGADAAAARAGLRQLKAMLAEGCISEYVFDIIEAQTADTPPPERSCPEERKCRLRNCRLRARCGLG